MDSFTNTINFDVDQNEPVNIYHRHLVRNVLNSDDVVRDFIKSQDKVSQDTIDGLFGLHNQIKNKRIMIVIGKNIVKSTLTNLRNAVVNNDVSSETGIKSKVMNCLKPILTHIHPEHINVELSDDERIALVNDIIKKKNSNKSNNIYVIVASNIVMSLVSSNITSLLGALDGKKETTTLLTNPEFDDLYNKIKPATPKRTYDDIEDNVSVCSSKKMKTLNLDNLFDNENVPENDNESVVSDHSIAIDEDLEIHSEDNGTSNIFTEGIEDIHSDIEDDGDGDVDAMNMMNVFTKQIHNNDEDDIIENVENEKDKSLFENEVNESIVEDTSTTISKLLENYNVKVVKKNKKVNDYNVDMTYT